MVGLWFGIHVHHGLVWLCPVLFAFATQVCSRRAGSVAEGGEQRQATCRFRSILGCGPCHFLHVLLVKQVTGQPRSKSPGGPAEGRAPGFGQGCGFLWIYRETTTVLSLSVIFCPRRRMGVIPLDAHMSPRLTVPSPALFWVHLEDISRIAVRS